jgi:hypothetical protein
VIKNLKTYSMKRLIISIFVISSIYACTNENNEELEVEDQKNSKEEMQSMEEKGMYPLVNMYGEDSINAEGNIVYGKADELSYGENKEVVPQIDSLTNKKYTLGPRSDVALSNMYGEDSIDTDGNFVYPAQDTLWVDGSVAE